MIRPSVASNSNTEPTIGQAASDFLASLSPEERQQSQNDVLKFARWLGMQRRTSQISPSDVAGYADQLGPSEAKPVRAFLSHIRKKGLTGTSLASHVRVRKQRQKPGSRSDDRAPIEMTRDGYEKLQAELAELRSQSSSVAQEIQRAAADKDFRENAPLQAARERKSHIEGRIQEIEASLKAAKIVGDSKAAATLKVGDTVLLTDTASGQQVRYTLVSSREANPMQGRISSVSPIGRALLGKAAGQVVEIQAPAGAFHYRIDTIEDR
ncbi:MAG: GreA/GreB family elongation factor [Chloroflexota bacterium]